MTIWDFWLDCKACGLFIEAYTVDVISENEVYRIDGQHCLECGRCAEVCPEDAMRPPNDKMAIETEWRWSQKFIKRLAIDLYLLVLTLLGLALLNKIRKGKIFFGPRVLISKIRKDHFLPPFLF
jgi:ferredoxin